MAAPLLSLDEVEYSEHLYDNEGFCVECKEFTHDSTEPDATGYQCPACKRMTVYGLESMLLAGWLEVR